MGKYQCSISEGELSVLCSNLAKGCEKQYLTEEMNLFNQLAAYYKGKAELRDVKSLDDIAALLKADLADGYAKANAAAESGSDRGALRALVWSEKVSRMQRSLLDRYAKEGEAALDRKLYVCDICGFIYAGSDLPELCPVCKVPSFKMLQIGRR